MRALFFLFIFSVCAQAQVVIGGVTNAASYTAQISPGGLATIFGTGLGSSTQQATTIPLPFTLAGVSLTIGTFPCPLLFANGTQINFEIPAELGAGTQDLVISTDFGDQSGQINLLEAAPGLFYYGTNQAIAVNYSTGDLNGPSAPVASGDYLIVYLTGIGPLSSTPADGFPATGISSALDSASASIGSADAPVSFLGLTPGDVGLAQANIQVPSLANGDYPLSITINGNVSVSVVVTVSGTGTVLPNVLTYLSSIGVPAAPLGGDVQGSTVVQANGQYAYVCGALQISVVDVSNPSAPVVAGAFGAPQLNGQGSNCVISDDYLVDVVNGGALVVFDLATSPTAPPFVVGPLALQVPLVNHIAFDGTTLLLDTSQTSFSASGDIVQESGSLEAYTFANFTSPVYAGTYVPPAGFTPDNSPRYQIAPLGNQYVAVAGTTNDGGSPTSGQGVVDVLDTITPSAILGVVEVPIPGAVVAQEIAVQGTQALVVGNTQAFNNPITFSGNVPQFLSSGNLTLSVVDFTNPQSPVVLGSLVTTIGSSADPYVASLGQGFFAVSHVRSFADIGGAGTLAVVDINDPSNLIWIPVATLYGVFGMTVQGNYLYVSTLSGLNIYQIALPLQPLIRKR